MIILLELGSIAMECAGDDIVVGVGLVGDGPGGRC